MRLVYRQVPLPPNLKFEKKSQFKRNGTTSSCVDAIPDQHLKCHLNKFYVTLILLSITHNPLLPSAVKDGTAAADDLAIEADA